MKYTLLLTLLFSTFSFAQTPVITSGKYVVIGNGAAKEFGNQSDAKSYANKLFQTCRCDIVIDQPSIHYEPDAVASSSKATSSSAAPSSAPSSSAASSVSVVIKPDLANLEFGRPLAFRNGKALAATKIKQYWLVRELNGTAKNEIIAAGGDTIIYYTTFPVSGEKWFIAAEVYTSDSTVYSQFAAVQF